MLKEIILKKNQQIIKDYIEELHAHDLSIQFEMLNQEERAKFYHFITDEKLAEMVTYLDAEIAAKVFAEFDLEKQTELFELMEPDDAADIILELNEKMQDDLIEALGEESDIVQLINYDEDETGSAMTNLLIELTPEMGVKDATKKVIREAPDVESINTLFVVDSEKHLLGAVHLINLLKAKHPLTIGDIMVNYPHVYDNDPIIDSIQAIRNYALYELPVVNSENHLVGMITLDDAIDIYQEEAMEDFEKLSALPETTNANAVKTAFHRLPWLMVLLAFSIPISIVTSFFEIEAILMQVALLIVFQPMILDSAGNVATQTLAVTLKLLTTQERNLIKNSYREVLTGMINGLVIGAFAFGTTLVFAYLNTSLTVSPLLVAFVVGFSLWMTVLIAPIVAILIPITLKSLKIDPAVASGPFITTIIDIAALIIYFGMASLFILGGLV